MAQRCLVEEDLARDAWLCAPEMRRCTSAATFCASKATALNGGLLKQFPSAADTEQAEPRATSDWRPQFRTTRREYNRLSGVRSRFTQNSFPAGTIS